MTSVLRCACCHAEVVICAENTTPRSMLTCLMCEQIADGERSRLDGRDLSREEITFTTQRVSSIRFARRLHEAMSEGLAVRS